MQTPELEDPKVQLPLLLAIHTSNSLCGLLGSETNWVGGPGIGGCYSLGLRPTPLACHKTGCHSREHQHHHTHGIWCFKRHVCVASHGREQPSPHQQL